MKILIKNEKAEIALALWERAAKGKLMVDQKLGEGILNTI